MLSCLFLGSVYLYGKLLIVSCSSIGTEVYGGEKIPEEKQDFNLQITDEEISEALEALGLKKFYIMRNMLASCVGKDLKTASALFDAYNKATEIEELFMELLNSGEAEEDLETERGFC